MIKQFLRPITRKSESAGIGMLIPMRGLKQRSYISKVVYDVGAAESGRKRQALAIIHLSLFERWSATVKEAKAIGEPAVLSDIPVLREQNPGQAIYFPAHDGVALVEILWDMRNAPEHHKPEHDKLVWQQADPCMMDFAARYPDFVLSAARVGVYKGGSN